MEKVYPHTNKYSLSNMNNKTIAQSSSSLRKKSDNIGVRVYLDYAATAPVKKEVLEAMLPYLTEKFGNPSSLHSFGQEARGAVDDARRKIASFLNCDISEIVFTSGGTESDNMAIKGLVLPFFYQGKTKPHVITSQIEHHAVINTCKMLEKNGVEVTYLKPNLDGLIEVKNVKAAIKENTVLVSIMYVNNEIGTVQPIREIGKMLEVENRNRKNRIYFHTDAVQATQYQNMNVDYLHVDLLTISGHKIGSPKGIGTLYLKKNTPIIAMMHGGEQENNRRAGTENVAGIVALGQAVELINIKSAKKIEKLRDYFIDKILKEIPETELNGSKENRSPNNANFYFKYIEGESILLNLDLVGIAASSGSACTSQSLEPSHVLVSIYNDPQRAHGSIRFTLGDKTTKKEIDYTVEKLKIIVKKLRDMSPLYKK